MNDRVKALMNIARKVAGNFDYEKPEADPYINNLAKEKEERIAAIRGDETIQEDMVLERIADKERAEGIVRGDMTDEDKEREAVIKLRRDILKNNYGM